MARRDTAILLLSVLVIGAMSFVLGTTVERSRSTADLVRVQIAFDAANKGAIDFETDNDSTRQQAVAVNKELSELKARYKTKDIEFLIANAKTEAARRELEEETNKRKFIAPGMNKAVEDLLSGLHSAEMLIADSDERDWHFPADEYETAASDFHFALQGAWNSLRKELINERREKRGVTQPGPKP